MQKGKVMRIHAELRIGTTALLADTGISCERKRDLPEGIVPIDILDHGDGGKEAVEDSGHRRELGMVPTLALQLLLVTNCTKNICWLLLATFVFVIF